MTKTKESGHDLDFQGVTSTGRIQGTFQLGRQAVHINASLTKLDDLFRKDNIQSGGGNTSRPRFAKLQTLQMTKISVFIGFGWMSSRKPLPRGFVAESVLKQLSSVNIDSGLSVFCV